MKANEAPEKIWGDPATDLPKLSGHIDKNSVEYTRTDAFIEKACDYLRTLKVQEFPGSPMERAMTEEDIDVFKEAMEE